VSGADVALPHPLALVTVNIPELYSVIDWLVALLFHTLPVGDDDVSVTLSLPHMMFEPCVIDMVGVAGAVP